MLEHLWPRRFGDGEYQNILSPVQWLGDSVWMMSVVRQIDGQKQGAERTQSNQIEPLNKRADRTDDSLAGQFSRNFYFLSQSLTHSIFYTLPLLTVRTASCQTSENDFLS